MPAALRRIGGSAIGWFVFALCFSLLLLGSTQVMLANGGFCASGGPYEIAEGHECSDFVLATLPWVIPVGIFAVLGCAWLAAGFGVPLTSWAWPILFCGLGAGFILAFVASMDVTFIIVGVLFEVMGLVPVVLALRSAPREFFIGSTDVLGHPFAGAKRLIAGVYATPHPGLAASDSTPRAPGPVDVVLAWAIAIVFAGGGVWLALVIAQAGGAISQPSLG